jgi:hypothetical protein
MIAKLHDMTPNMMMLDVYVRCLCFPKEKKRYNKYLILIACTMYM